MRPHAPDSFAPKAAGIVLGDLHRLFPSWHIEVECYGLNVERVPQAYALNIWFPVHSADLKAVGSAGSRPGSRSLGGAFNVTPVPGAVCAPCFLILQHENISMGCSCCRGLRGSFPLVDFSPGTVSQHTSFLLKVCLLEVFCHDNEKKKAKYTVSSEAGEHIH